MFKDMLDPMTMISGGRVQQAYVPPPCPSLSLNAIDSLYMAVGQHLDPTLTLFYGGELVRRVSIFKEGVIKGLETKTKELGLSRHKITKETLEIDVSHILTYLSRVCCRHTLLINGNGEAAQLFKADSVLDSVLVINKTESGSFELGSPLTLKESYKRISEGVKSKLVKDVRSIAISMGIDAYDGGSPKKLHSKKKLIELIAEKVTV